MAAHVFSTEAIFTISDGVLWLRKLPNSEAEMSSLYVLSAPMDPAMLEIAPGDYICIAFFDAMSGHQGVYLKTRTVEGRTDGSCGRAPGEIQAMLLGDAVPNGLAQRTF
jgi:hypothetical protein